jgi:hypothetical protein
MKSGTTWLYNVISQHPEIYFSYEKEVHYFAHLHTDQISLDQKARVSRTKQAFLHIDPNRVAAPKLRQKLIWYAKYLADPVADSWYENLFSSRRQQTYCADFSNLYCHMEKDGWDHVKNISGNVKVTYLMRNPIERLWSHIRFHLQITGRFAELQKWTKDDCLAFAKQPFIWSNGEYAATVRRLRSNLTETQLNIGFAEDMHADPRSHLRAIEDFLGISHFDFPEQLVKRRVNESPSATMPAYFHDLFSNYAQIQASELAELGFPAAQKWLL